MKKLLFLTLFGLLGVQASAQKSTTFIELDEGRYDQMAEGMNDVLIENIEPWGKQKKPTKAVLIIDGDYIPLGNITLVHKDTSDAAFYRGDKDTSRVFPLYNDRYSMSSGGILQGADGEKLEAILITPMTAKSQTAWLAFDRHGLTKNIEHARYEKLLTIRPDNEDVVWAPRGSKHFSPGISSEAILEADTGTQGSYALSIKGKWGRKYGFLRLKQADYNGLVKTQVFEPIIDPHDPSTIHRFELKDGKYVLDGKIKVRKLVVLRTNVQKATGTVKRGHDGRDRKKAKTVVRKF